MFFVFSLLYLLLRLSLNASILYPLSRCVNYNTRHSVYTVQRSGYVTCTKPPPDKRSQDGFEVYRFWDQNCLQNRSQNRPL